MALDTHWRSLKSCDVAQKTIMISGHTSKPDPLSRENAVSRLSLIKTLRIFIAWLHSPPPRRGRKCARTPKGEADNTAYGEDGHTYVIYYLNFQAEHDSYSDSKWLLTQSSKFQMENKSNSRQITRYEFNAISKLLGPTKLSKHLNSYYSPIIQGCMNTCTGRSNIRNPQILLYGSISSTIAMVELT